MRTFGQKLTEIRKAKNLTQSKLEQLAKISKGMVGKYETGERSPNHISIRKLCKALNCSPNYLFDWTNDLC